MPPFFKDDPALQVAPLAPSLPLPVDKVPQQARSLARTHNRLGGLLGLMAAQTGTSIAGALAVWIVESGAKDFVANSAIIRFENHKFFERWGRQHEALFDQHFQFGGHAGVGGRAWENHKYRRLPTAPFAKCHSDQTAEYDVLSLGRELAGAEHALWGVSMGGPQIMGFHAADIGYAGAAAMYEVFQTDERAHVLGFYDLCRHKNLLRHLAAQDWLAFATGYNGEGKAADYATKIESNFTLGTTTLRDWLPNMPSPGATITAKRATFLYERPTPLSKQMHGIPAGTPARLIALTDRVMWEAESQGLGRGFVVASAFL